MIKVKFLTALHQFYLKKLNSGVEWLGDVPEHWNLKKFCYLFDENKKKNIGLQETNVLSLSYGNILCTRQKKITH